MLRFEIDVERYYKFTPFGIALEILWLVLLIGFIASPAVSGIIWVSLIILLLRIAVITMRYRLWKNKVPKTLKNVERFFYTENVEAIFVMILFGYYGRFFESPSRMLDLFVCFVLAFSVYAKTKYLDRLKEESRRNTAT